MQEAEDRELRSKLVDLAREDLRKGDVSAAVRRYVRLGGVDPRNPSHPLRLGDLLLRRGDRKEAVDAWLRAGALFARAAFDDRAIAVYKRALEVDPERIDVCEVLAEAHERAGHLREAAEALGRAADLWERRSRRDEALLLRRRIARLFPEDASARRRLADELARAGLVAEAIADYAEVILELARRGEPGALGGPFEALFALRPEAPVAGAGQGALRQVWDDALTSVYREVARIHRAGR